MSMGIPIWDVVADVLAPLERLTPAEWAERYRVLKEGTTDQPGAWSNSYFPWLAPIMDAIETETGKRGAIFMKSGQVGGSEAGMNLLGWAICQRPGPMLYLTSTDNQAREFSRDRFDYMTDSAPVLVARRLGSREHRDTTHVKRFAGAKLAIWGSGSTSKVKSEPYHIVCLDEVDELPDFPGVGSAWALAEVRMRAFRRSWLQAWSTPTVDDRGIAEKFERLSDQRRWHIRCPHCEDEQWLQWGQVGIEERRAETAKYICRGCGAEITDAERSGAIFGGRYQSVLEEGEAKRRPFAGFHISRLYDPYLPLSDVAASYLACGSEADLQVFYNNDLGEPYTPAATPLLEEDIQKRATRRVNESAPPETQFLTCGIDVQHGFNFYVDISAWTKGAVKHLLWYGIVRGWEALRGQIETYRHPTEDGRTLPIQATAIDCGYETSQVYNFCKRMGGRVVPTKYDYTPKGETWAILEIATAGNIHRYCLERTHWMDRAIGRFGGGDELAGVVLPVGISDEYRRHVLANQRIETVDRFGNRKRTWEKKKGFNDDYIQAAVNAEFAAELCGLSRMQREGEALKKGRAALKKRAQEVEGGFISRDYRQVRKTWLGERRR